MQFFHPIRRFGLIAALLAGAASPAGVTISNPWFRLIVPQVPAGGYLTLHNAGARPATLTGASSSACGMLMLHRTEGERMTAVNSVTIPPGGTLSLSPGGYHLMCMQPQMTVGTKAPLTLHFAAGGTVDASVPVIGARGHPPDGGS